MRMRKVSEEAEEEAELDANVFLNQSALGARRLVCFTEGPKQRFV